MHATRSTATTPHGARPWLALLASLALAACASAPPAPTVETGPASLAREAADRGDWPRAATQWEAAATAAQPPADALWVEAADAWWRADDALRSTAALRRVNDASLDTPTRARAALLRGEMAIAAGDADRAEFYLSATDGLPGRDRRRLGEARDELELLRRDPAARTMSDVAALLEDGDPDTATALQVVQLLERVPSDRLAQEALRPTRTGQWSALTLDLRRTVLERRDLLQAADEWATLNPLHPVDQQQYMELAWQYDQRFAPPERIAVLLPATGSLTAAGEAIRDGLLSAWVDHPTRSELTFMPVGEAPTTALEAYRAAERGGYDWVIGPLRRESVQLLVEQPGASVPALLLNWPDTTTATSPFQPAADSGATSEMDFFSLALSQEAEAAAVAERMLAEGHRQAILLLADNGWGERTEAAFVDAYLDGGGEVVSLERFRSGDADHSAKLTRLLQIQDGRERRRQLQGLLGIPLEFEDSRRDDFGAFFLAADPALGRQIKPQLRFFDAGEKPVFAMSRVYTGKPDPSSDGDLNGVVIPATRWALREAQDDGVPALASERNGAFTALHALGRDAWNLLPWLETLSRDPSFVFPGATGDLSLAGDGRLLRDPVWAVFQRGRPVALQPPAPPVPAGAP